MSSKKVESKLWSLVETRDKEFPVFSLFLRDIPETIEIKKFSHMISIFWSYPVTDDTGLPSTEIIKAHSDIEKSLKAIDDHIDSLYVAQITGNGRKEWIWYTKDIDKWWDRFSKALKDHPKYPLDIETAKESNWKTYRIISKNMD
ncbi:MAG: DUF695 domain-containing protein [Campylobacterota bacterium]|nr:DUF695 domain-containing protein [Campylobacterota bacterium]